MTIPTEPLFIGARYVQVKFYAAPRNPGDPSTIVGTLTLMPDENVLVLDAIKGDKGDQGEPAPFWRPQWQSTIVDPADLLAMQLGDADAGRAWYISGYWHVWTGDEFIQFLGAIPGPPGPTPVITMTAEQILAPESGPYGEVLVTEGGTAENPTYRLSIPGIVGPKGDNSRILESLDYYGETPLEGQTLLYSANAGGVGVPGFAPGDPSPFAMKWITFPEASFGPGGTFSATRTVILSGAVPAQEEAYYPVVDGHLRWQRSGIFNSAQVEIEVRWLEDGSTDGPETGELIGRALYDPGVLDTETISHIRAHHSDHTNPSRSISPDTNVGRIEANVAIRCYVLIYRSGGSGNYVFNTKDSYLSYEMFPIS